MATDQKVGGSNPLTHVSMFHKAACEAETVIALCLVEGEEGWCTCNIRVHLFLTYGGSLFSKRRTLAVGERRKQKMKALMKEFKEFISRGNVMDMAVGVIIGGAFTAIVTSLVNDVMMPILSLITGGIDFTALYIVLGEGENAATLNYGSFIAAVINFLLIALVIFLLIKVINKLARSKKEEPTPVTVKICPFCKEEISVEAVRCPHCTSELTEK